MASQLTKTAPSAGRSEACNSAVLRNAHAQTPHEEDGPMHMAEEDQEQRGRLKRRRMSSHSPPRAPSPSRGHDRESGSRHRHHYRKHHRPSSPSSASITPPPHLATKHRRRSDAEPDHTLRGRARKRSGSRARTRSPILEEAIGEDKSAGDRSYRKRSQPPSRHRDQEAEADEGIVRRQRSYPNLYKGETGDEVVETTSGAEKTVYENEGDDGVAPAVQEV